MIPAVETTEPLSTEVAAPAAAPAEQPAAETAATEAAPATNGETKETPKAEKRKSTLPFSFGKKKEGSASDEEGVEKPKSPFSKLRATIKVR